MAKDPAERYESAGDLARAAWAALQGEVAPAPMGSVATGAAAEQAAPAPDTPGAAHAAAGLGGSPPPPTAGRCAGRLPLLGRRTGQAEGRLGPASWPKGRRIALLVALPRPARRRARASPRSARWAAATTAAATAAPPRSQPPAETARAARRAAQAKVVNTIDVGDGPDGITVDGKRIFVSHAKDGTLLEIDADLDQVVGEPVDGRREPRPDRRAARARSGWSTPPATSSSGSRASRRCSRPRRSRSARTRRASRSASSSPGSPTRATTPCSGSTARRPQTVGDPIGVGDHPIGIHVGSKVWVTNFRDGTLSKIDIATAQVEGEPLPTGAGARGVTEGFGGVWVSNLHDDTVTRVDPETFEVVAQIPVGKEPKELVAALGSVWVVNSKSNTVTRIDPTTNRVSGAPIPVGRNPIGIAATKGAVWVTNFADDTVSADQALNAMDTTGFFNYPTLPAGSAPEARRRRPRPIPASSPTRPWRSGTPCWPPPRRSGSTRATWCCGPASATARSTCCSTAGSRPRAPRRGRRRPRRSASRPSWTAQPRAVTLRARTHGELARMSWDAYEALAARDAAAGPHDPVRPRPRPRRAPARRRHDACPSGRAEAMTAFPNYTQIPARLPVGAWQAIRVVMLLGAIGLAMALVVVPDDGLFVLWKLVIPVLPLAVARRARAVAQRLPAVGLQPDAARARPVQGADRARLAQGVRLRDRRGRCSSCSSRCARSASTTPARRARCCCSAALTGGFIGGMLLKGKSGWCSSICPLLPIQRLYGQTPYKLVANSHCTPCVGCTKSCYDFNPKVAFLADLNDPDPYWGGYRKLFAAAFPGLVLAFFNLPEARGGEEILELYGQLGALPRGEHRGVLHARLAAQGLHAQGHDAVRRGRLLALLLVRRPDLRRRRRRLDARGRQVGRARRRDPARRRLAAAHVRQGEGVRRPGGRPRARARSRRSSRSPTSPRAARWPRTARSTSARPR